MVAIQMRFRDFEKRPHLEQYIYDHLVKVVEPFIGKGSGNFLKIIVSEDSRKHAAKPHIVCESILKLEDTGKTIVTKKASYNFYESINKAAISLRKVLRKKKERLHNHKREKDQRELEDFLIQDSTIE